MQVEALKAKARDPNAVITLCLSLWVGVVDRVKDLAGISETSCKGVVHDSIASRL